MSRDEELREAFIAGYRSCLYAYAIHKDGGLFVGVQQKPYKEVRANVPNNDMAMADLRMFLDGRDREA